MSVIIPDPRFEAPELFDPGRKPVGNVVIDLGNNITRNLQAYVGLFNGLITSLVRHQTGSGFVGADVTITPPTISGNDGGGGHIDIPVTENILSTACSIVTVFEKSSVTEAWASPLCFSNTTSGDRFEILINSSGKLFFQSSSHAWTRTYSIAPANDKKITVVATRDSAGTIKIHYLDSSGYQYDEINDSASVANDAIINRVTIQASSLNTITRAWRGKTYAGGVYNRVLSKSECLSLLYDPYQFLIPA